MLTQAARTSHPPDRLRRSAPHLRPRPKGHVRLLAPTTEQSYSSFVFVSYQPAHPDQFTYHYPYGKLNHLRSEVYTSEIETAHSRSSLWKRDAAYYYYDHGPLRRTVLGQENLQGLDYAYTLQGWIKGLNGSLGDDYRKVAAPDLTMDGYPDVPGDATDRLVHRDLYRYANQYFHEDDKPIGSGILNPMDNVLPPDYELFNGNIVRHYQATAADGFRTAAGPTICHSPAY